MTGSEASAYLLAQHWGIRRKPATLATLRSRGGAPPFRKAGRDVIYEPADLGWMGRQGEVRTACVNLAGADMRRGGRGRPTTPTTSPFANRRRPGRSRINGSGRRS